MRRGVVELGAQRVAAEDSTEEARRGADKDPARFLTEKELHDGRARGAEGDADTDLLFTQGDLVGEQAVGAEDGEEERERAEDGGYLHEE
jgi:hypothetical protein